MHQAHPGTTRAALAVAIATLLALLLPALASASAAPTSTADSSLATFEGRTIDLREGWGEARACSIGPGQSICFRSESALDRHLASDRTMFPLAACSTSVRLYSATGYGGSVLHLSNRGVWHNLSAFGFDNTTSSYKIGACSSTFADGSSGSGSYYPGSTSAGAQASTMSSGWDNRVSSVYIA